MTPVEGDAGATCGLCCPAKQNGHKGRAEEMEKEGGAGDKVTACQVGICSPFEFSWKNIRGPVRSIPETVYNPNWGWLQRPQALRSSRSLCPEHFVLHLYFLFPWSSFIYYASHTTSSFLTKSFLGPRVRMSPLRTLVTPRTVSTAPVSTLLKLQYVCG